MRNNFGTSMERAIDKALDASLASGKEAIQKAIDSQPTRKWWHRLWPYNKFFDYEVRLATQRIMLAQTFIDNEIAEHKARALELKVRNIGASNYIGNAEQSFGLTYELWLFNEARGIPDEVRDKLIPYIAKTISE